MFHFGFSYVGLIYLLMLFIPNGIWTKNQPKDYEKYVQNENKVLQTLEKIGEVLVCCFVLIFSDFNVRFNSVWSLWLLLSFMLMLLYEIYWIQYFRSEKNMSDFYRSILGIPVAGATLPVCAFFLLGVYGCNIFLMISTVILGIGHIGIHLSHYKKISKGEKKHLLLRIVKWLMLIILLLLTGIAIVIVGCRNLNYTFQKNLVSDYTIINWDQRGCGRTYFHNMSIDSANEMASFEQAQTDLNDLVDYACERFHTEQVIIVGHSYGTMLGSQYVMNYPEKVSAYIGVGQVVTIESDIYSYEDALEKAKALGDDTSEMEAAYRKYEKDKSLINMMNLRNYTYKYHVAQKTANTIWSGVTSPYMGVDDVRCFFKQAGDFEDYVSLNKQLFDYIMETDVRKYGLEYRVPVGFITGSDDWTTPEKYAQDYYQIIQAPKKQFASVQGCGHAPQYDSPEEFCNLLKNMLEELF